MPEKKERPSIFINAIIRALFGLFAIYFMNMFLEFRGIDVAVGLNGWTALTSGILGVPGVALLYGILFYQKL